MVNIKPWLKKALQTDEEITGLFAAAGSITKVLPTGEFGGEAIPALTFDEDDNVPYLTGDSRELASEIIVTVHIWAKGSTNPWLTAVDRIMRDNFRGRRMLAPELSDVVHGVKIYHRPARYRCRLQNPDKEVPSWRD